MKKEMLINVLQPEECRIAIVEDGVLEELYVERTSLESYTGNIYKGKNVNLEPAIQAAFDRAYQAQYGFNPAHVPTEVVSWRLTARGPLVPFDVAIALPLSPGKAKHSRKVHLWRDDQMVPVYERRTLAKGQTIDGPVIIEERETTIVVLPGWTAQVDEFGCVVARLKE